MTGPAPSLKSYYNRSTNKSELPVSGSKMKTSGLTDSPQFKQNTMFSKTGQQNLDKDRAGLDECVWQLVISPIYARCWGLKVKWPPRKGRHSAEWKLNCYCCRYVLVRCWDSSSSRPVSLFWLVIERTRPDEDVSTANISLTYGRRITKLKNYLLELNMAVTTPGKSLMPSGQTLM